MLNGWFPQSNGDLTMTELIQDRGIAGRPLDFLFIFRDRFFIAAEALVCKTEMVMHQRKARFKTQSALELFHGLHTAICILIRASQEHVWQGCFRVEFSRDLQFSCSLRIVLVG